MNHKINFASDNNAGAHPAVLQAIQRAAALPYAPAYGADEITKQFESRVRELFGATARPFLVFNGTGANVLANGALLKPFQALLAAETAHIENDECGGLERMMGSRILRVPSQDGKITPQALEPFLAMRGNPHNVQPGGITISQTTECGTIYSLDEIKALSRFARSQGLFLHVDGSRFSNAVARLGTTLKAMSEECGIDALSFGGTKNGLLLGEAVIFFNDPDIERDFPYVRKQGLQLASKMRFVSSQFLALFENELWLKSARHANAMADRLALKLRELPGCEIVHPVQGNAVFARLPQAALDRLADRFHFYVWDPPRRIARLMTSFETTPEQVDEFTAAAVQALSAK